MGSSHSSSVRATHFQRPSKQTSIEHISEDECDDHHISISNKMVERLVEDAALAGGAASAVMATTRPKDDFKDKVNMEKLKCLDETHSERYGLTVADINEMTKRIDMRTTNMVSMEAVCGECKQKVIDCYNTNEAASDIVKCWDTVGEFSKCVSDAAAVRLRARTQQEAREHARRTRHVAHAREHALRELASTSILD